MADCCWICKKTDAPHEVYTPVDTRYVATQYGKVFFSSFGDGKTNRFCRRCYRELVGHEKVTCPRCECLVTRLVEVVATGERLCTTCFAARLLGWPER